jgi:outer membrane protein TolC
MLQKRKHGRRISAECLAITFAAAALCICLVAMPRPASAQEEPAPDLILVEGNVIKLPLQSVIFLALKNNLQIAFQSLAPDIVETEIMREESFYDPDFSLQYGKTRSVQQVGNFLTGAGADSVYQQAWDLKMGVMKQFVTGTSAELKWNATDSKTDFTFQQLVPQYKSDLTLNLTQPLLKDFGIEIGESMIKIANLNFEISQYEFKNQVMEILNGIEKSYWSLYFQIKDYEARQKSLKAAEDLLREFKIRIDAGTLAPIEIYQAEAEVAERKQDLIVAADLVKDTEDRLKTSLNFYDKQEYWDVEIIPAADPRSGPITVDFTQSLQEAFTYRPDYIQAKMDIEARNIMVKYTKNQTLPRVDLFGTLGTMGLAGRGNPDAASIGGGGGIGGKKNLADTRWNDVADSMASGDYYNYAAGVKIQFPFGNRFAKSQYSRAKIESARAATLLKDVENNVINDVRGAVRQIDTDIKRIEAARATMRLADERLKAEQKKYAVGLSTTHDLLEFQDELAKAESRYAFAKAAYEQNLADLAKVKGTLLESHNITID